MSVTGTSVASGCVVLTGMPGAGKTTTSRLVAQRLPRSACMRGEDLHGLIVNGGVWALGEPADEAARQVALTLRNLAALAANFADAGFVPMVDTVIADRGGLDLLSGLLAPRPVLLVVLAPGIIRCQQRNQTRAVEERWDFNGYDDLEASMSAGFGQTGWWFDTATLTPDETADQIVDEVNRRGFTQPRADQAAAGAVHLP